jgi:hypothetical protein
MSDHMTEIAFWPPFATMGAMRGLMTDAVR